MAKAEAGECVYKPRDASQQELGETRQDSTQSLGGRMAPRHLDLDFQPMELKQYVSVF